MFLDASPPSRSTYLVSSVRDGTQKGKNVGEKQAQQPSAPAESFLSTKFAEDEGKKVSSIEIDSGWLGKGLKQGRQRRRIRVSHRLNFELIVRETSLIDS